MRGQSGRRVVGLLGDDGRDLRPMPVLVDGIGIVVDESAGYERAGVESTKAGKDGP